MNWYNKGHVRCIWHSWVWASLFMNEFLPPAFVFLTSLSFLSFNAHVFECVFDFRDLPLCPCIAPHTKTHMPRVEFLLGEVCMDISPWSVADVLLRTCKKKVILKPGWRLDFGSIWRISRYYTWWFLASVGAGVFAHEVAHVNSIIERLAGADYAIFRKLASFTWKLAKKSGAVEGY